MTDGKPVENKPESPKAADAPALSEPTAGATPQAATSRNRMKLWLAAGGAAVALAGGVYGYKHFTAKPATANAQSEPPAVAQSKQEAPPKTEVPTLDPSPTIKPPTRPAAPAIGIDVPDIKPPAPNKTDTDPPPIPMIDLPPIKSSAPAIEAPVIKPPEPSLELPPVRPPAPTPSDKPGTDIPTITMPTGKPVDNKKPATPDPDLFKAPDPLPTKVTDNEKPRVEAPIIPIKGEDPKPPLPPVPATKEDPPVPSIKIPGPPTPMKTEEAPTIPELKIPTPPMPMKTDDPPVPPVIGPTPMKMADPPSPPMIPVVPPSPPLTIDPPSPMPGISAPPPPPAAGMKPEKKDVYDEDWHTQRDGDTYAIIAFEYLKDKKYAAALEAYNRDRYKASERIIRVPPTWVLEEQFPNLVSSNTEMPKTSDITTTGGTKEETAPPKAVGVRPAPPAANDEYRVISPAGETIREIAQKVYGNGDAWRKLWDLNPNLDPTQPIPTGTALRLGR